MGKQRLSQSAIARYGRQKFDEAQKQARRDWERSTVGSAVLDVARMGRSVLSRRTPTSRAKRAVNRLSKFATSGGMGDVIASTKVGSQVMKLARLGDVDKYSSGLVEQMVGSVLSSMFGPLGGSLAQIVFASDDAAQDAGLNDPGRDPGVEDSLRAALEFINLVDPKLLSGKGKETLTGTPEAAGLQRAPDDGTYLQASPVIRGREGFYVTTYEGGRMMTYPRTDPMVTGEMIPVQSSNVHSIGFIYDFDNTLNGVLKVRFLQGKRSDRRQKIAGPLYFYYNVEPKLFREFRKAISAGVFVWDNLRVRGTVSGHQKPYELKGVAEGYVPRKATRYGGNEYYIQRQINVRHTRTGSRRTISSEKPDRLVQPYPDRGTPGRGAPNRGRPNRGR